jgi:prepilin-type N-terminal cleavage/methylation domain-containing protein
MKPATRPRTKPAFTLIEMLIVLAIIGVLAAIIISQIANATFETRRIVSRQQQVVLQTAVSSWIMQNTTTQPISSVRTAYNTAADSKARLALVGGYLDADVYAHFMSQTTDVAKVQSDAMKRAGKWIELPDWASGSYPRVNLLPVD